MRMLTGSNKKKGRKDHIGSGGVSGCSEKERDVKRIENAAEKIRGVDVNNERESGGSGTRSLGDRSGGSGSGGAAAAGGGGAEMMPEGGTSSAASSSQRGRSSRSNIAPSASNSGVGTVSIGAGTNSERDGGGGELGKACQAVVDIASEKLIENVVQVSKRELFS
mmetsp:Transcript_25602/g.52823  ORF Transcript_25602/g.52823 Transcript_25602/m.52823 type:complete len:165 (+) Transcript_25602:3-497(+)